MEINFLFCVSSASVAKRDANLAVAQIRVVIDVVVFRTVAGGVFALVTEKLFFFFRHPCLLAGSAVLRVLAVLAVSAVLKAMDFFGSASSFVTIAEKIALRNERNNVWIFCSTGRASNDSLGGFRFGFSFVAVLTDRVVYFDYFDYFAHLFWNREKTSKINDELGSLRDPSQRLEGREEPVRRSLGVRQPTVGENCQGDVVDSQANCRGTRKKERGRF